MRGPICNFHGSWPLPSGLQNFCYKVTWESPLYVTCCFSLPIFNILLFFFFFILIMVCLGVVLWSYLRHRVSSWTWISVSFPELGKFSAIMSSNMLSESSSLSSLSGILAMWILVCMMLFQSCLKLSSFLFIFFFVFSFNDLHYSVFQLVDLFLCII